MALLLVKVVFLRWLGLCSLDFLGAELNYRQAFNFLNNNKKSSNTNVFSISSSFMLSFNLPYLLIWSMTEFYYEVN